MSMGKRLMVLTLALLLAIAPLTGCTQSNPGETGSVGDASPSPSASEPAQTRGAEDEGPGAQGSSGLPLTEETVSFTIFMAFASQFEQAITSMADYPSMQYAESVTNVHIDWLEVAYSASREQTSIIMASGEYPDAMSIDSNYTGGQVAAIDDNVIYDLAPMMEEYAPDMLAYYMSDDVYRKNFYNSNGTAGGIFTIRDENGTIPNSAMMIRYDWLDGLNMEVPTTYGELYDYMVACRTQYGADSALLMDKAMLMTQGIQSGYDTKAYIERGRHFYQIDGVAYGGITDDGARDFLKLMSEWYSEGLISRDWMSISDAPGETARWSYVTNDESSVFMVALNQMSALEESGQVGNPDFRVGAIPYLTVEKGGQTHMADGSSLGSGGYTNISTNCENPELFLSWFNFWWTEEGSMLANYGVQGESWDYDAAGNWYYTDLVMNSSYGTSPSNTVYAYSISDFVRTFYRGDKLTTLYTDEQMEVINTWLLNTDTDWNMPKNLTVLTQDADNYSVLLGDIETLTAQSYAQFILGNLNFEEDWDAFVEQCNTMGYETCVEYWQKALDDYNGV